MTVANPDARALMLAELLNVRQMRLVFAESCTGGLAATLMTQVPGISSSFCGSAVTYRELTKSAWLKIDPSLIQHESPESECITDLMAIQVLRSTPEADIACAITGHLGPTSEVDKDGLIFLAAAIRLSDNLDSESRHRFGRIRIQSNEAAEHRTELRGPSEATNFGGGELLLRHSLRLKSTDRIPRQLEAAVSLLQFSIDAIKKGTLEVPELN